MPPGNPKGPVFVRYFQPVSGVLNGLGDIDESEEHETESDASGYDHREELMQTILGLPPAAFEKLCLSVYFVNLDSVQ